MKLDMKEACITTSWDDGHLLDLRIAELLEKHGLPGTFYVPLTHNKRPLLSHQQIRELSESFEIGGHTVNHCDLLSVPDEVADYEIKDCKQQLEQISGRPCVAFCFPKGHFRRRHVRAVAEAGFRTARTVELMSLARPMSQNGVFVLPTTMIAAASDLQTFARNSLKRFKLNNLLRYLRCRDADWVATTAAVLREFLAQGGVFHLWGHSWEIGARNEWENLDRVFALLEQCKREVVFLKNSALAENPARDSKAEAVAIP